MLYSLHSAATAGGRYSCKLQADRVTATSARLRWKKLRKSNVLDYKVSLQAVSDRIIDL